MRFKNLPLRLQLLIIIQCLAAAATAYGSWKTPQLQDGWMLGFLILVTYWPGLSLFLPRLLGM